MNVPLSSIRAQPGSRERPVGSLEGKFITAPCVRIDASATLLSSNDDPLPLPEVVSVWSRVIDVILCMMQSDAELTDFTSE